MEPKGVVQKYTDYLYNEEIGIPKFDDGEIGFSYLTDGFNERIELDSVRIWDLDDNEREFNEGINEYEPIDKLTIRKLKAHVEAVNAFIGYLEEGLKNF